MHCPVAVEQQGIAEEIEADIAIELPGPPFVARQAHVHAGDIEKRHDADVDQTVPAVSAAAFRTQQCQRYEQEGHRIGDDLVDGFDGGIADPRVGLSVSRCPDRSQPGLLPVPALLSFAAGVSTEPAAACRASGGKPSLVGEVSTRTRRGAKCMPASASACWILV